MDHEAVLADYAQRMTPTQADAFLGVREGTVSAAIRRGEIAPYRFPDAPTRAWVTPAMLAAWLTEYCRVAPPVGLAGPGRNGEGAPDH